MQAYDLLIGNKKGMHEAFLSLLFSLEHSLRLIILDDDRVIDSAPAVIGNPKIMECEY